MHYIFFLFFIAITITNFLQGAQKDKSQDPLIVFQYVTYNPQGPYTNNNKTSSSCSKNIRKKRKKKSEKRKQEEELYRNLRKNDLYTELTIGDFADKKPDADASVELFSTNIENIFSMEKKNKLIEWETKNKTSLTSLDNILKKINDKNISLTKAENLIVSAQVFLDENAFNKKMFELFFKPFFKNDAETLDKLTVIHAFIKVAKNDTKKEILRLFENELRNENITAINFSNPSTRAFIRILSTYGESELATYTEGVRLLKDFKNACIIFGEEARLH